MLMQYKLRPYVLEYYDHQLDLLAAEVEGRRLKAAILQAILLWKVTMSCQLSRQPSE